MRIVVPLGLSFHFLALASAQGYAELASAIRRRSHPQRVAQE
jgi:hypothetical protein